MTNRCSPNLRFCILTITFLALSPFGMAVRVPAHIFPDEKSNVMTHLKINESELEQYSKVLAPGLEQTWYWTTYKEKFTGYVNKEDIEGRNRLKKGTVIRINPTYSSWSLTRYEADDKVRVRSRLSVGRVSLTKEIPVYFRLKRPDRVPSEALVTQTQEPEPEKLPPPIQPIEIVETATISSIPEPSMEQSQSTNQEAEDQPDVVGELDTGMEEIQPAPDQSIPPIPDIAEISTTTEKTHVGIIDPLLEEIPRISPQELVNLAAPPADLFQEFEGYLRLLEQDDPQNDVFKYQLETRSGRRIVYVDTAQLINESFLEYVNMWINIRGTLEENQPDLALYIEARSIWVSP